MSEEERKTLSKILERIRDICDMKTKFRSELEKDSEIIHKLVESYCYLKWFGDKE